MSAVPADVVDAAAVRLPEGAIEHPLTGFRTLFYKESLRFWKVGYQTVAAPILTAVLYLMIFSHVLEEHVKVYGSIPYTAFLIPGLVMMSMLQNAFANSTSSLIQSKVTGNLVFVLLTPLSNLDVFAAYVLASMVRGLVVGAGVLVVTLLFAVPAFAAPLWILVFALLATAVLGTLGLIAGIWAEKFDQVAAFQNFLIMPATFLSGVFYSVHSLPPFWYGVSRFNPFFYMIDGFRYGFFGVSDVSPWESLAIVGATCVVLTTVALRLLGSGYKTRHCRSRRGAMLPRRLPFTRISSTLDGGSASFADPQLPELRIMMTKETIRDLIAARIECTSIDVRGDDGAHFEATIVSPAFDGKSRVARHQLVYAALGDHMAEAIHALSFKTLTPVEAGRG
jgi:ABC-2 type transport system permease protein